MGETTEFSARIWNKLGCRSLSSDVRNGIRSDSSKHVVDEARKSS
jgi:hypothetical protein